MSVLTEIEVESSAKPAPEPVSWLTGTLEPFFVAHWDVVVGVIAGVASLSSLPLPLKGLAFAVYTFSLIRWCRINGATVVPVKPLVLPAAPVVPAA